MTTAAYETQIPVCWCGGPHRHEDHGHIETHSFPTTCTAMTIGADK